MRRALSQETLRRVGAVVGCLTIVISAWHLFDVIDPNLDLFENAISVHDPKTNYQHDILNDDIESVDISKLNRLIVAAHYHEDVEWTKHVFDIPVMLIEKDNPENPDNVGTNNMTESTSYLYYMIKYYDELPDVVAFIHGHGDLQVLKNAVWRVKGYQPLPHPETVETCNTLHEYEGGHMTWMGEAQPVPVWPGDPMEGVKDTQYQRAYHTLFRWLKLGWKEGGLGLIVPQYVTTLCCSAFSVDRDTIRGVPKDRLVRLFEYLESGVNIDMGVTMEYVWILLFNQKERV